MKRTGIGTGPSLRRALAAGAAGAMVLAGWVGPATASDGDRPPARPAQAASTPVDPVLAAALSRMRTRASGLTALAAPTPVVWDEHDDALGDTAKTPELAASAMAVYADDPSTKWDESSLVWFFAETDAPTVSGDWAYVWLDTNGDDVDDVRVVSPDLYMDLDQDYWSTVDVRGGLGWSSTGRQALWQRMDEGYVVGFDWRRIPGLTAARYVFELEDETDPDLWDLAPDDYVGSLVALPPPSTSVTAKARRSGSVLYVDVNPNLPKKRYWKFRVYQQRADGSWRARKTSTTLGSKETRTINLPKGTYKVVVLPKYGYQGSESAPVTLRR
ncbi:MAG: hypothetical protein MUF35_03440 [Candidatus Nanopelagicales bacterium]|nr:hypothetical protein [Candidatus Nanopelagicales bacterium]